MVAIVSNVLKSKKEVKYGVYCFVNDCKYNKNEKCTFDEKPRELKCVHFSSKRRR